MLPPHHRGCANRDKNITIADQLGWLMSEDRTSLSREGTSSFPVPLRHHDFAQMVFKHGYGLLKVVTAEGALARPAAQHPLQILGTALRGLSTP
jgi:hypothetical protein